MKLLVPAYGHPVESPGLWSGILSAASSVGSVIINPASGVGTARDATWTETTGRLRSAGVPMAGYVNSDWGRLDLAGIVYEARMYQRWYGLEDVFVDCLPSQHVSWVSELVTALRVAGVQRIIGNPGTHTDSDIGRLVDVLVDYENDHVPPPTSQAKHEGAMHCWIGHGLDWNQAAETLRRARRAGIDWIWVTDGTGANPYHDLPTYWHKVLESLGDPD